MLHIINKHQWGDFYKIVKPVYHQCLTCQIHNPRKHIFVPRGLKPPPSVTVEHFQLDFIQLSPSMGHQYAFVIVWTSMFSDGLKLSPAPRLMPVWGAGGNLLEKCVSHLEYTFHSLQWSRNPLHWATHTSHNEDLANISELLLSLPMLKELMGSSN